MPAIDRLSSSRHEAHEVSLRETASGARLAWALCSAQNVYVCLDPVPKLGCLTVYLFENALSVDNIFRFLLQRFLTSGALSAPCDLLRHSRRAGGHHSRQSVDPEALKTTAAKELGSVFIQMYSCQHEIS